jgi:flavoprotein
MVLSLLMVSCTAILETLVKTVYWPVTANEEQVKKIVADVCFLCAACINNCHGQPKLRGGDGEVQYLHGCGAGGRDGQGIV